VQPAAQEGGLAVYFSPNGHCTDAVVSEIQKAKYSIRVLAYRLTSPQIDSALVAAKARGVEVSIVLDGAQQSKHYSDATFFANSGLPVLIDSVHAIAHNKVMLIDDSEIITGSFNFTGAAETANAENLLVLAGKPALAKAYSDEFQRHVAHAKAYVSPSEEAGEEK
jgi:phosphatidylserine/phosphatidylglycerophosphate/cardiolipin synthase-like enzyme